MCAASVKHPRVSTLVTSSFVRRLGAAIPTFLSGTFAPAEKRIGFIRIPNFLDANNIDRSRLRCTVPDGMTFMQNNTDGSWSTSCATGGVAATPELLQR